MDLDGIDRSLIAALRKNARSPISSLAAELNLSRATVKQRIDRLCENGTIRRFTIEVEIGDTAQAVRAVVMIGLEGSLSRAVIRALSKLPAIVRIHTTNGVWDLVAEIECQNLRDFDAVLRQIREVRGVLNSESCLLLTSLAT